MILISQLTTHTTSIRVSRIQGRSKSHVKKTEQKLSRQPEIKPSLFQNKIHQKYYLKGIDIELSPPIRIGEKAEKIFPG